MAELIKIYPENPHPRMMDKVVQSLRRGGLVIYPTDTVYALGCDINNMKAMQRVAQIKGQKLERANMAFICQNLSHLSDFTAQLNSTTFKLLKHYFPGPYTFILPSNKTLPHPFKKRKTVGIRVPDHPVILEIVKQLGNPILTTSIHDDDRIIDYTTDPEIIYAEWRNKVDVVIDSGFGGNIPSTVIDATVNPPNIIRQGKGEFYD
jgi:tRNA threonylcarbamoyl adenosine modification protein (Sua5/YciO/YrdC/YwlC family)